MFIEASGFALFGLIFGSFSNVLIYRLPRGIPIGLSRSRCTACGGQIKWYDNIPVISFLLLRGRCRACAAKISARYPLTEIFTAFLWTVPVFLGRPPAQAVVSALFTTVLAVIAQIDFSHMIIPDSLVAAVAALSIPGFIMKFEPRAFDRLIGAAVGGGLLYLMAVLSEKILKKEGMGGGDIKLLAAAGLILGWRLTLLSLGLGSIIALVMVAAMYLLNRRSREERQIPFAPALAVAMALCHYFGEGWISWYFGLFY